MEKFKVKLGLNRLSVQSLIFFLRLVISEMTGNLNFVTPNPPLLDLTTELDKLEIAAKNAKIGGPAETAIKDEQEAVVRGMFDQLGSYIQTESNGVKSVILSAGVFVADKPEPIGLLSAPAGLTAHVSSLSGVIDLDWERVHGSNLYTVDINETDSNEESTWSPVYATTKSKCSITALEPGKFYRFRVRANGAAGASGASFTARSVAA